ncbi:LuxR C-terminal-related transcriptional regulator [Amycolatopsis sp. NPDC059021]|uniref:helix-turn-helix transcriptional regulator n=1 Tax=Amycolatopsis sp. NPDC059021 TaxID=3346704 RepID=UPI00366E441F
MRYVEYDDALKILCALDGGAAGGGLVIVSGSLASGKTSLLHEFSQHSAEAGMVSLTAVGSAAESTLQFAVIEQMFRGMGTPDEERLLALLARASAVVEDSEHVLGSTKVSDPEVLATAREMGKVLSAMARERIVSIAVDDIHFVDRMSMWLLLYLWRRLRSASVRMVVSEWVWPRPTLAEFQVELSRFPHRRLRLGPMSEDSITRFAKGRVPADEAADVAAAVHRLSSGNPLLVNALVREYEQARRGGAIAGTGAELTASDAQLGEDVVACLRRWGPQVLDVARGLAVLGERATPAGVSRLIGRRAGVVEQIMEILATAGFADETGLRQPAARKAVLAGLPARRQAGLHAEAARVLYAANAPAPAVAGHLVAAGPVPGAWVVPVLREAAERALRNDDDEFAVCCLELAAGSVDGDAEPATRAALVAGIARAAWRSHPSLAAPHRGALHAAALAGDLSAHDRVSALRHALWFGDEPAAEEVLATFDRAGRDADAQLAVRARLMYRWVYGAPRNEPEATRQAGTIGTVWTHGVTEATVAHAERVLHSGVLADTTVETLGTALLVLALGAGYGKVTAAAEQLLAEAGRRTARVWQAVLTEVTARIALLRGEIPEAARLASEALEVLPAEEWGVCVGWPLGTLTLALTTLGQHERAGEVVRVPAPDAMSGTLPGIWYQRAVGHHRLATGRILAAVSDFRDCGELIAQRRIDVPELFPWRGDLAEATLQLGRRAEARSLAADQLGMLGQPVTGARGGSLLLLAACSEPAKRVGLLRQAVEAAEAAGDGFHLVRALTELSKAHQEAGESERARAVAKRAAEEAAYQGHAVPEPARPPRRPEVAGDPLAVLSGAELRVARLAGRGHSNIEIGGKLFLTVSTVEQHLTRVYRKLGVASRRELATLVGPAHLAE